MAEPAIAQKSLYELTFEPGSYWRCRYGRSNRQSFCDESHKRGEFEPEKFEIIVPTKVVLCGCRHTSNKPYCDGSRNELD